jgi:hypothetical protein
VAKNQVDAEAMMAKLDACIRGIEDVREQQADWRLTDVQKTQLKSLLTGRTAKVQIGVIPTDRNASLMGIDLLSVLKDSGWDATGLTSDFTLNPALVGVVLIVNHQDFPEAALLQSALRRVGIQANGEIDGAKARVKDALVIEIAIGAKPPVSH